MQAGMSKTFSIILGVILTLLGLLGFISNPLIGTNSIFATDTTHNVIHIILGSILLVVAFLSHKDCALWLKIIGAIIFLLGLIGVLTIPSTGGTLLGIVYANGASNFLHLVAGIVMFISGVYGKCSISAVIAQSQ